MPAFGRRFDVEALGRWDDAHAGNAVRALFERWAMPGFRTNRAPLRVGVRDGYLNFYVNGQSVVRLSMRRSGPRASIHQAYVAGRTCERAGEGGVSNEQQYVDYDQASLADPATAGLIDGWIATADSYAGEEKRFVDRIVRANEGVLDLEMALPADDVPGRPRTAPRMDLVVLQGPYGGPYSLGFWEAKLSSNHELRARSDYAEQEGRRLAGPKVVHQLRKYQSWMEGAGRVEEVRKAYLETTRCLLDLYGLFGSRHAAKPPCVRIWEAVLAADTLDVVLPPGLVVSLRFLKNRDPMKECWEESCWRAEQEFKTWREKLESHGITVKQVGLESGVYHLMPIEPGVVTV